MSKPTAKLYIVATPMGNLEDISFRAIEILKKVDLIAAEDTRHSSKLLHHFNIQTPMMSLHEHNEDARTAMILEKIKEGKNIALISDAGTPLISDPGYRLVSEARKEGVDVIPIPGACAAIAALSVSGLPSDRFIFEGFLPPKSTSRKKRLEELKNEVRPVVFYESPYRILDMLKDCEAVLGESRKIFLAKELTKIYETTCLSSLKEMLQLFENHTIEPLGEFVVILSGAEKENVSELAEEDQRLLSILLSKLSVKDASEIAHKITEKNKNVFYKEALKGQSK